MEWLMYRIKDASQTAARKYRILTQKARRNRYIAQHTS
jgi:hypothetical protein